MAVKRSPDQFLWILIAVVFASIAVIFIVSQGSIGMRGVLKSEQTQSTVDSANTASDLMKELDLVEDDAGAGEIESLQKDAASL